MLYEGWLLWIIYNTKLVFLHFLFNTYLMCLFVVLMPEVANYNVYI